MSHPILMTNQEYAERYQHRGNCVLCKHTAVWCEEVWVDKEKHSVCMECISERCAEDVFIDVSVAAKKEE